MHTVYPFTTFDTTITYPSTDYPVPSYTGTGATAISNGWAPNTAANALKNLPNWSNGSGRKGILACHGLGSSAWKSFHAGDDSNWSDYARTLSDSGYVVVAVDLGAKHFGNNLTMVALDKAFSYLTALTGQSKVGLIGSSAGGLAALNWLHKRSNNVKATFLVNPFIDVDILRGSSDWTVPYSVKSTDPNYSLFTGGGASNASASDVNSAYLCANDTDWQNNAVSQFHTPARYPSDYAGMRLHIAKAQMDGTIPYQQDVWWVGAVNSPTVSVKIYTGATLNHVPNTMLAGGNTDAATLSGGGMPRAHIRDFFHEFL